MAFISQLPSYQASAPDWGIMTNALAQSMQQYRQGMNEQFKGEMERNRLAMDRRRLSMDENADMRAALMHPLQLDALRASNQHALASESRAAAMHPLQLAQMQATNNQLKAQTPDYRAGVASKYGMQPGTPEYNAFVLNGTYTPRDPMEGVIADMFKQGVQAPQQPPPQGGVIPQSNTAPTPPPGIVLAADAPPSQAPTGTMAGSMFSHLPPEQRRRMADAFLMHPKTKAMGEQMIKDLEQGNLEKSARGEIEKKMVGNIDHMARLNEIEAAFRPEYLQAGFRIGQSLNAAGEVLGMKLSNDQKTTLAGYASFRADTARNFNQLLKENSGTAVTENEYKRMQLQEPSAAGNGFFSMPDSPTEFMAKLKASASALRLAVARQNYMRRSADPAAIANAARTGELERAMPLDKMKGIIDQRLDQEAQRIKAANPNVDDGALRQHLRQVQRQEFGI